MSNLSKSPNTSGIDLIRAEMGRQHGDATASLDSAATMAKQVAASIRRTGRLALIGMGGSHCVNRTAEALYRAQGIEALAITASEQLYQPLPGINNWTQVLVSQSGGSAEIIRMLDGESSKDTFALTLDPNSTLASTLPSLVGVGGPETAYAATRSLLITLALHAAILEALGASQDDVRTILATPPDADVTPAVAPLEEVSSIIFSARSTLVGVAEAAALGLLELARMPGFAIEGGQFRHGPIEALNPDIGVVLLRANDVSARLSEGLAEICVGAGITPIVFDTSGQSEIPGCVTIVLPQLSGLAAVFAVLPPLQKLLLAVAQSRVDNAGVPVRAQKITDTE